MPLSTHRASKPQSSDARWEKDWGIEFSLPNGSLHEPDDPEADGQTEYRGSNCKTDLFAHESLLITPALTPTQDARWKEGWGIEFGYKMGACIELVSDSSKVGRFTKATTKSSTGDAVRPADVSFATTTGILNPF